MTIVQEAEQYLTEQKSTMMEHQIPPKSYKLIESLLMEIRNLEIRICGMQYPLANKEE